LYEAEDAVKEMDAPACKKQRTAVNKSNVALLARYLCFYLNIL